MIRCTVGYVPRDHQRRVEKNNKLMERPRGFLLCVSGSVVREVVELEEARRMRERGAKRMELVGVRR
jgi:hypothetical protein